MQATLARDAPRASDLLAQHFAHTTSVLLRQTWPEAARHAPGLGPPPLS